MTVTAEMLEHLRQNVTFLCPLWRIAAKDGTVAAYCAHARTLTFNGTTYYPAPVVPSETTGKTGLDADSADLTGVLDDVITEADLYAKKWEGARVYTAYVNYMDLTMGAVAERNGFAGRWSISNGTFTVEFNSLSKALEIEMGDLTSAVDRNRTPEELNVSMAPFTHARAVASAADRRLFTVDGATQADGYFMYGRAEWGVGSANAGLQMEIEYNTGNQIYLAMPMPSAIEPGDTLTLIAGYNGTREQARDKFDAAINVNCEPDLPGLAAVLTYPE